jgi:hypothetical protein
LRNEGPDGSPDRVENWQLGTNRSFVRVGKFVQGNSRETNVLEIFTGF